MATRKRTKHHHLSAFVRRRAKLLNPNPAVPVAVSNFSGLNFVTTWRKFKFAVFDRWLKRSRGRK